MKENWRPECWQNVSVCYMEAREKAEEALRVAKESEDVEEIQKALSVAYKAWARPLEKEPRT